MSAHRILIIGCGGREHAIAKALKRSKYQVNLVIFGNYINPALFDLAEQYFEINILDINEITRQIGGLFLDLVVIGPEAPLEAGISDALWAMNIPCVGPTKRFAQIETSKFFARQLLYEAGLQSFSPQWLALTNDDTDEEYLTTLLSEVLQGEYVIKADGLCGGKGVKLSGSDFEDIKEGVTYCQELLKRDQCCLIEEKLVGEEFSIFSLTDGQNMVHFPPVQDYKKAYDGDCGPNTGGMGSVILKGGFSFLTPEDIQQAEDLNFRVVELMQQRFSDPNYSPKNQRYRGVIYGSYMKTESGQIKVIEYNCRFGDPEVINLMHLLETDLVDLLFSTVLDGYLRDPIQMRDEYCVVRYVCPEGYPEAPLRGIPIDLSELPPEIIEHNLIFASLGMGFDPTQPIMRGSRAIAVVHSGPNLEQVLHLMDMTLTLIGGSIFYRNDIGESYLSRTVTYSDSGVNVREANQAIEDIKYMVLETHQSHLARDVGYVVPNYGHFGGVYQSDLNQPQLITSMDGIGTKIQTVLSLVNQRYGDSLERREARLRAFESLGHDLFANNVNDILCVAQEVQPLYFLDYFSCEKLDRAELKAFIKGLSDECQQSNCALLGGETAELRDFTRKQDEFDPENQRYDIVGSIAGSALPNSFYDPSQIQEGDYVIGLGSSGPHTNGYTLINHLLSEELLDGQRWIRELSAPHVNYEPILREWNYYLDQIKGVAHITGGGFEDNPRRILPEELDIMWYDWEWPEVFREIQRAANLNNNEMYRTFNCGIGMIVILSPEEYAKLPFDDLVLIGTVVRREL